jgi:Ca2+/H+ antiporter, TMEM165/GDT1 family
MIGRRIFRFLKMAVIVTAAVLLFGFVVTHLWNYVMPSLFGLHLITFRQALALVILGRLLFGGFRPGRGGMWRGRMMERWEQMTPEQREKFRDGMRGGCGRFRDPAPEPKV